MGADIAREAEAFVFLTNVFNPGMPCGNFLGVILGAVIDEDDFVVWIIDIPQRSEAAVECLPAVVGADDH